MTRRTWHLFLLSSLFGCAQPIIPNPPSEKQIYAARIRELEERGINIAPVNNFTMNVTIIATDSKKLPWQLNDIFLTAQHYNDMHPSKDYLQTILVRIPKGSLTEAEIHNAKQSALVTATAFRGRFITELNVSFGE